MKFLINDSFKALRSGEFVVADSSADEFIFDSENTDDLSVAAMIEISEGNGFLLKKGKKDQIVKTLVDQLTSLELPEMNDKTDSQKVEEIVAAGVEAEKDDEEMLIEIIQSGVKFKAAGKLFAKAMEAGGFRITSKARKAEAREMLVDAEFEPENYDDVKKMCELICEEVNDTTTSQAFVIIKGYCKEFELELPKPTKEKKSGLKGAILAWIVGHPTSPEAGLVDFIESTGRVKTSEKVSKMAKRYLPTLLVANKVHEAATAES